MKPLSAKPKRKIEKKEDRDRMTIQHTETERRNQSRKYHAEFDPVKRRPKR